MTFTEFLDAYSSEFDTTMGFYMETDGKCFGTTVSRLFLTNMRCDYAAYAIAKEQAGLKTGHLPPEPGETKEGLMRGADVSLLVDCIREELWQKDNTAKMMTVIAFNIAERAMAERHLKPDDVLAVQISIDVKPGDIFEMEPTLILRDVADAVQDGQHRRVSWRMH